VNKHPNRYLNVVENVGFIVLALVAAYIILGIYC